MAPERQETVSSETEALTTTIGLYALKVISLDNAAERTDVTRWEMVKVLEDTGVEVTLGPQSMGDLEDEVEVALERD